MFAGIFRDSGAADEIGDIAKDTDVEQRLLTEYRVISDALDRLGHGYEAVEGSIRQLHEDFPLIIRYCLGPFLLLPFENFLLIFQTRAEIR